MFDENASCHLAIGAAYPTCLKNSDGLSEDELKERGLNHSLAHVDFMIGHENMNIKGITKRRPTSRYHDRRPLIGITAQHIKGMVHPP